jgi:hypothetical protein
MQDDKTAAKPAHTPGPWRTGRKVFRTIYCEEHGTEGRLIGVMDRREDATLVAAAPKMLARLREVRDFLDDRFGQANVPLGPDGLALLNAVVCLIAEAAP